MAQNKATKKFLRLLEKEIRLFNSFMVEITEKTLTDNVDLCRLNPDLILSDELADMALQELTSDQRRYVNYGHKLEYINDRLTSEEGIINDFSLLEEVFEEFKLSEQEKIDIIIPLLCKKVNAYYKIKALAKHLRNLHEYPQAKIENYENYELFSAMSQKSSFVGDLVLYIKTGNYSEYLQELDKAYEDIKMIINNDQCYASENPEILIPAIKKTGVDLSERQVIEIVNYSKEKFLKLNNDQENERELEAKKAKIKQENKIAQEKLAAEIETGNKERRNAIQELKSFLINDNPARFLSDEEIDIVLKLLVTAGYTKQQTEKIKKNILENNKLLLELERKENLKNAKIKYLSLEEIDTLASAEAIIANNDSTINPLYNKIKANYNFIINQLLIFYDIKNDDDPTYNDDAEITLLCIEELKSSITEYIYSDYKYALALSKKGN